MFLLDFNEAFEFPHEWALRHWNSDVPLEKAHCYTHSFFHTSLLKVFHLLSCKISKFCEFCFRLTETCFSFYSFHFDCVCGDCYRLCLYGNNFLTEATLNSEHFSPLQMLARLSPLCHLIFIKAGSENKTKNMVSFRLTVLSMRNVTGFLTLESTSVAETKNSADRSSFFRLSLNTCMYRRDNEVFNFLLNFKRTLLSVVIFSRKLQV